MQPLHIKSVLFSTFLQNFTLISSTTASSYYSDFIIALIRSSSKVSASQCIGVLGQSHRKDSSLPLAILPLYGRMALGDLVFSSIVTFINFPDYQADNSRSGFSSSFLSSGFQNSYR